ncbi:exosortase F system-associated membrane protein [Pseudomonas shirazensis]
MLNKILENKSKIVIAVIVVLCFAIIRVYESQLFYDPFLAYFDSEFKNLPFPQVDVLKLFGGLLLRYFLNTILSLVLIYSLFQDSDIVKFSSFLFVFFLVLLLGFFLSILAYFPDANWLLFYVRRFIIQPIFLLLFIPAFYYQQQNLKK